MKEFLLLGYSGHSYVVIDAIYSQNNSIIGYYDINKNLLNPYKLIYKGKEKKIIEKKNNQYYFPSVGSNSLRKKLIQIIEQKELNQAVVCHKSAQISNNSKIEISTFISANVTINSLAHIKKGCIINSGAIIEHECVINEYSHIAPGAVLAGNVTIGKETFIGANSVIIQGVKIGNNVIIGAGSVVLNDIDDNQTWVGNPAKRIK